MYWVHGDQLGTPVMLTNTDGNAVWEATFSPFGEPVSVNEDPDGDGTAVTMNIRLPGQYFDAETGLNCNWHRYYDPAVGRYVQAELPESDYSTVQPYNYVGNSPLFDTDRLGLNEDCTTIHQGADPTSELFPQLAGVPTECSPSCSAWRVQICEGMGETIAKSSRSWFSHNCLVKINADIWNGLVEYPPDEGPANDANKACIFFHERCHLRKDGGDECPAYKAQATCEAMINPGTDIDYFDRQAERACAEQPPSEPGCGSLQGDEF